AVATQSIQSCSEASIKMVSDCKVVTNGRVFNPQTRNKQLCDDLREGRDYGILLSTLDGDNWMNAIRAKTNSYEKAALEQFMCFQHLHNGTLRQGKTSVEELCSNVDENGRNISIHSRFRDEQYGLHKSFLLSDHVEFDSNATNARVAEVEDSFNACNPFSADGSASGARNLNDEANEIIGDDNDQIAQATQAYEDNKEQDTQWLGTGVSSSSGSRSIA